MLAKKDPARRGSSRRGLGVRLDVGAAGRLWRPPRKAFMTELHAIHAIHRPARSLLQRPSACLLARQYLLDRPAVCAPTPPRTREPISSTCSHETIRPAEEAIFRGRRRRPEAIHAQDEHRDQQRGSIMPTIFDLIYREYCRARLAEMRKQLLLVSAERHEVPSDVSHPGGSAGAELPRVGKSVVSPFHVPNQLREFE
jgi:hypothetical protein